MNINTIKNTEGTENTEIYDFGFPIWIYDFGSDFEFFKHAQYSATSVFDPIARSVSSVTSVF